MLEASRNTIFKPNNIFYKKGTCLASFVYLLRILSCFCVHLAESQAGSHVTRSK